jgi:two-component system, chemotaxis family, chemotaxis protein CheY
MESLPDYSQNRFLVVDDISYVIDTIAEMLKRYNAGKIFRAESPETALMILAADKSIDCVISDFNMKPVNGIQFLTTIRTGTINGVSRDQRFILVTGHGEVEVVTAAKALDVSGYIVKPFALDDLVKTLKRAFSGSFNPKSIDEYKALPPFTWRG